MDARADEDQRLRDLQRQYVDVLDDSGGQFTRAVKDLIESSSSSPSLRVVLDLNHLRRRAPERARGLLADAGTELVALGRALKEFAAHLDPSWAKERGDDLRVGLEGSLGGQHVSPRTLTSSYLNRMVCVEGIVTKCSLVHPKVRSTDLQFIRDNIDEV